MIDIKKKDAVEALKELENNSVDLVVTDPAYESLEKHRAVGTTTRLKDWFPIFGNDRLPEFFTECYRVLKPNRHLYVMCDQTTLDIARPLVEAAGFNYHKFLVWNKISIGMGYHWRSTHELVIFASKGKRRLNNLGAADVINIEDTLNIKKIHSSHSKYPTEKPVELFERLIANSTSEGELVVDPFMGAGNSGLAAARLGRRYLGIDIEEGACTLARQALKEYVQGNPSTYDNK